MGKRGLGKKAQEIFGLSFSMIFAIILIIFFIVIAFIAIKAFLDTRDCAKIGIFSKEINDKVESAWKSNGITTEYVGDLPSKVEKICFANISEGFSRGNSEAWQAIRRYDSEDNMFIYPPEKACTIPSLRILHINLAEMIEKNGNPFCIDSNNGRISVRIEKASNEKLVRIEK